MLAICHDCIYCRFGAVLTLAIPPNFLLNVSVGTVSSGPASLFGAKESADIGTRSGHGIKCGCWVASSGCRNRLSPTPLFLFLAVCYFRCLDGHWWHVLHSRKVIQGLGHWRIGGAGRKGCVNIVYGRVVVR